MNAMAAAQRMTAQEYLATPNETLRSELVDGELIVHGPSLLHQLILRDLARELDAWARAAPGRGEISWPQRPAPRHSTSRSSSGAMMRCTRRCYPASASRSGPCSAAERPAATRRASQSLPTAGLGAQAV